MILTQDAARRVVRGDVLVEDGVIAAVGEVRATRPDRVVDAAGGLVTPGLVNAHTHVPMTLFRGLGDDLVLERWLEDRIWPAERRLDERAVRAGMRLGLAEMIRTGTTLFADMYFFPEALAEETRRAGLYAVEAHTFLDFPTPDAKVEEMESKARAFVKRFADDALVTPALGPHSTYACSEATLAKVSGLADELGGARPLRVLTHCAETRREVLDVEARNGRRPVGVFERAGLLRDGVVLAHCGWVTKEEARRIGAAGASVAHCPVSNMKLATGGVMPLPELDAAGVAVGLGTDGAASNNTLDVLESAKFAALAQKNHRWDPTVVPAERALDLATRDGARALGFGDVTGSIEPGKRADLVLWSTDAPRMAPIHDPVSALVYAGRGDDARLVVAGGRVLYEDGRFATLDVPRVVREARSEAERVTRP